MDFTQGAIPPNLVRFALPILLANLLQASMQLVNGLWVGNLLGSEAFAAVTVATTLLAMVLAFVLGINNATLTIFAQLRGAGDDRGMDRFLGGFTLVLLVLSLLVGGAGFVLAGPLLVLLDTPPAILAEARSYLQVPGRCSWSATTSSARCCALSATAGRRCTSSCWPPRWRPCWRRR